MGLLSGAMFDQAARDVLRLYEPLGPKWSWYARLRWRLTPFSQMAAHVPVGANVWDIGCGVGLWGNYLMARDPTAQVFGVDLSERRIQVAQATVGGRRGIQFEVRDARALSEHRADVITMTDFLHHLRPPEQESLLTFLRDRLNPGGRMVIVEVIERPRWKKSTAYWLDFALNQEPSHFRSAQGWRSLFDRVNLHLAIHPAHRGLPLADAILVAQK
jgi:trans-aconitate methyltransferase